MDGLNGLKNSAIDASDRAKVYTEVLPSGGFEKRLIKIQGSLMPTVFLCFVSRFDHFPTKKKDLISNKSS